jgi:hypothetical protein
VDPDDQETTVDHTDVRRRGGRRRWPLWLAGAVAVLLVVAALAPRMFADQIRAMIEARMNEGLTGYSVTLPAVDVQLFGLALTLHDLTVTQDAFPDPAVAFVPRLYTSVQWRELLRGRLVADFLFDEPVLHIHLAQLMAEVEAEEPLDQRGWRNALEAAHFLDLNLIRVRNAAVTYIDEDPERPLHARGVQFEAADIRAAPSPQHPYPSPFQLEATLFDDGRLALRGDADFLAEPRPAMRVRFDVARVPLVYFRPVAVHADVIITDGFFDASGSAELSPDTQHLHIEQLRAESLHIDYVNSAADDTDAANGNAGADPDAADEGRTAAEVLADASDGPDPAVLELVIDEARISGEFGLVDGTTDPTYRAFVRDATWTLTNYSNNFAGGPADVTLEGLFMGSGRTRGRAQFRPERAGADFDLRLEIRDTHLPDMNSILAAYGNFDVVDGYFSFFTELAIKGGRIDGYMRPLFGNVEVHDHRQDDDKGAMQQLYERAVGVIAGLLENLPRDEVATQVNLSGPIDDPEMSSLQIVAGLLRNAFFQAILPGFEGEVDG